MHLIVALLEAGHKVASIDLDTPQGTLTRYIENRRRFAGHTSAALAIPEHFTVGAGAGQTGAFERILTAQPGCYDYIVVDTPGHDTPLSRRAHAWADILITPINDSFVDLDVLAMVATEPLRIVQTSHYSDMVREANRQRTAAGGRETYWIILRNRLSSLDARNQRHMAKILGQLSQRIGFREGPGLRERVIYRELFLSGLTLLDLPRAVPGLRLTTSHVAARQELRQLLNALQNPSEGSAGTPATSPESTQPVTARA